MFRLSPGGVRVAEQLEAGTPPAADRQTPQLIRRWLDTGAIHPTLPPTVGSAAADGHRSTLTVDDVVIVTPWFQQSTAGARTDTPADERAADPKATAVRRIIVDDASPVPVVDATIRLPHNAGPAAARNAGRRLAGPARVLVFVDADVEIDVESDGESGETDGEIGDPWAWIAPLLEHFDDERVGAVAPRITGERNSPLDLGPEPARVTRGGRVAYVPATVLAVRADAFDDVGGFDEQLRFGEDVDFVWRLDAVGWRVRYEPSITVGHRPRDTWAQRLRQSAGYGTSAAPLALRHPTSLAPTVLHPWPGAALLAALGPGPTWRRAVLATAISGAGVTVLARRLRPLSTGAAIELVAGGFAHTITQTAQAARRVWWPLLALLAVASRRSRWALLGAIAMTPRSALRDAAYGAGVWRGMLRHRCWRPLAPRLVWRR